MSSDPSPKLRADVELLRVGPQSFLLRDPRTGHSFMLGPTERVLVDLIRSGRDPAEIATETVRRVGKPTTAREVLEFVEQLRSFDLLAEIDDPATAERATTTTVKYGERRRPSEKAGFWNSFFDVGALLFGWAFHPLTTIPILVLVGIGTVAIVRGWDPYITQAGRLMDEIPLVLLAALSLSKTFLLVNTPREAAIGVACRKFGGRVNGFRVHWLMGLVPFIHCEIGESALRLQGRARWTTLTAGLWLQALIGAVSAIGWSMAEPGSDLSTFWLVLLPACIIHMTLHFTIFLRMDAYRLLCAAVEDWRLRERAIAETRAWLGRHTSPEPLTDRERFWLRAYGIGFYLFAYLGSAALAGFGLWYLEYRMGPNGVLLGLGIVVSGFRREILAWLRSTRPWTWYAAKLGAAPARASVWIAISALLAVALLWPYHQDVAGRARVVPSTQAGLRARVGGTVDTVHVKNGERVAEGQSVLTLSDPELVRNLAETRAALDREQAELKKLVKGSRSEDIAAARAKLNQARTNLSHAQGESERERRLSSARAATLQDVAEAQNRRDEAAITAEITRSELSQLLAGSRTEDITKQEAEVERLTALLEHFEEQSTLLEVRAPISGVVATADVEERRGQTVHPGDLLAVVHGAEPAVVEVAASEQAVAQVREGMAALVRLTGLDGRVLAGRVVEVGSVAEPEGRFEVDAYRTDAESYLQDGKSDDRFVRVRVRLDEPRADLAPGLTGFARIPIEPDRFGRALARSILGYVRTVMWSWLP